jgi:hypothetical protein
VELQICWDGSHGRKVARAGDGEQIRDRIYTPRVHPIERLRYVARSQGAPAEMLVQESAIALGAFRDDPAGMVAACRRIIDRQLTCGPLWWLCARILSAPDPMAEARAAVLEMDQDPTGALLAGELPDGASVVVVGWPAQSVAALRRRGDLEVLVVDVAGEAVEAVEQLLRMDVDAVEVPARGAGAAVGVADLVLLESFAVGPEQALVPAGSFGAAAVARERGVAVWMVAGVGRMMPSSMFDALTNRWSVGADPLAAQEEVVPLGLVDRLACADGVVEVAEGLRRTDCPVAPELFRLAG